eukprot:CAMPEP_0176334346 /NCGR_PEP_ID=MMETSP0121_2-20121125/78057_1 /TAXON_ID=160619 /ORGANISM="Kryptoperidinium foliaceum, Strain CCMP 1326" /LENGTH=60 /DNA_ID=CAMNT_0017677297 /DNA_START=36 /DNA_END=216 /DNA_ORIENTATION=+
MATAWLLLLASLVARARAGKCEGKTDSGFCDQMDSAASAAALIATGAHHPVVRTNSASGI